MKRLALAIVFVLITSGTALAGGDQNQGTTGTGNTSLGSDAQGDAIQQGGR
ncbi:MAG: hypothetical protein HY779_05075 [Rubrobacteridae bacterium]|nr:hypothetical protein [Rubrobacteridae bacterium]